MVTIRYSSWYRAGGQHRGRFDSRDCATIEEVRMFIDEKFREGRQRAEDMRMSITQVVDAGVWSVCER